MDFSFLIKGIVAGLIIALPIGPVGAVCVQRLLIHGRKSGIISGLGGATADVFFASIAIFSANFISKFLIKNQFIFRYFTGFFLVYLGAKIFKTVKIDKKLVLRNESLASDYLSTFLITLSNPFLIFVFASVFAKFKIKHLYKYPDLAMSLIVGIFIGSMLWWVAMSFIIKIFKIKIKDHWVANLNKFFGLIIIIFGFAFLLVKKLSVIK